MYSCVLKAFKKNLPPYLNLPILTNPTFMVDFPTHNIKYFLKNVKELTLPQL